MNNKIWIINNTIQCQQLTEEYLEETVRFIEVAFFRYENICKTLKVIEDPECLLELRELTISAAKDGVTVIAIDKNTKKIVGASLNKIQVRNQTAFENFGKSWKRPPSKAIVEFIAAIDNLCDLFDYCQVDCLLELMYTATLPEYKGKGIAKKLIEFSIEIGNNLNKGINVKKSVDGIPLSLEPVPKIISAIYTSFITQKIGNDLGFVVAFEKRYDELDFQGLDFSDVVKSGTKVITVEYKRLEN